MYTIWLCGKSLINVDLSCHDDIKVRLLLSQNKLSMTCQTVKWKLSWCNTRQQITMPNTLTAPLFPSTTTKRTSRSTPAPCWGQQCSIVVGRAEACCPLQPTHHMYGPQKFAILVDVDRKMVKGKVTKHLISGLPILEGHSTKFHNLSVRAIIFY